MRNCLFGVICLFAKSLHSHCLQRGGGLAQAGLTLTLGRAQNLQICTNFQASYCPACAKPLVSVAQRRKNSKKSFFSSKRVFYINFNVSLWLIII
ncbi:MAG: hypothetical protein LBU83_08395 [Bacteroidales bacterium]|jgi:hypothetical protein|nr:hypothetical protein [Bacteroidales bacterium]